ncbi:MAG: allantoin racemase [Subtercola sp.]|nr:allantoin racemase [Subtercola sp.]
MARAPEQNAPQVQSLKTLTWLEATHGDPALAPLWRFLEEQVAELAAGRVKTRLQHTGFATGGIRTSANRLLTDTAILAASLAAESESDAIVIGCWGAPTEAVRSAVGIPVSSLPDASVRAIGSLARRAAVVTVAPALAPIFENDLRMLGATGFAAEQPVRSYLPESTHFDVLDAITDPADLIDRFDAAGEKAAAAGADAIVVGCGYLASIFTAHGYTALRHHPDIAVIDCNRLALEHALQLIELAQAGIHPSSRGYVRPTGVQRTALHSATLLKGNTP